MTVGLPLFDAGIERALLHGLVVVWIGTMALGAPRVKAPWLWAALALGVRLVFGEAGALMGRAYPYQHFLGYLGKIKSIPLYGQGWFATMDLARPVFGDDPTGLNRANLAFSVLTVLWLWEVVRRLTGDVRVAHVAAAMLACLPLAVGLAAMEVHFVLVALLEVTAVAGLVRKDTLGAALTVSSVVVLAHARPFEIGFATVAALALVRGWRVLGLAALSGIAVRVLEIGVPNGRDGFPNAGPDAWAPATLAWRILGPDSSVLLFNVHVHPFWLFPAAVAGGLWALRHDGRATVLTLGVAALLTTAPYAHMEFPTDVLRFQLPAATWWCALASLSAPWFLARGRAVRVGALGVGLAGLGVAARPLQELVTVSEFRFLATSIPRLPPGTTLRYDPVWDENGLFAAWAERLGPVHAVPLDASSPPKPGELVYTGVAARVTDRPPHRPVPIGLGCPGQVVVARDVPAFSGNLYELSDPGAPVHLEIARAVPCAPAP